MSVAVLVFVVGAFETVDKSLEIDWSNWKSEVE